MESYLGAFASPKILNDFKFRSDLRESAIALENHYRKLFAQHRDDPAIQDPHAGLLPVFSQSKSIFSTLPVLAEEEAMPKVLAVENKNRRAPGTPAVLGKEDFMANWRLFTNNSLQYLDWSNVFAAGGSVLSCLLPMPETAIKTLMDRREYLQTQFAASDIDLFIYGLNEDEARQKMIEIFDAIVAANPHEVLAFRTPNAISIVSQYPFRHIQIVLRLYKSPAEVLAGFDVDVCTVGFDGKDVWSTRRGHFALITQCNVIDITRRSPSYEVRLAKYADRGFEIRVPGLDRSRLDPQLFERSYEKTKGLSRLLLFEALRTPDVRMKFKETQRERKLRPPHKDAGQYIMNSFARSNDLRSEGVESSDYNTVYLPYGEKWTARRIAKLAHRKDFVLNHPSLMFKYRSTRHHQHPLFYGNMTDVLGDCCGACPPRPPEFEEEEKKLYVSGELNFIVDDPGRQEVGSFNPITDEDWTAGAYVPDNIVERVNAIADDDLETFKKFSAAEGFDINARDWMGRTPLLFATMCNSIKCAEFIITNDAKLALTLPDGRNPLHICAEYDFDEIARMLLQKSAENKILIENLATEATINPAAPSSVVSSVGGSFVKVHENDLKEEEPEAQQAEELNSDAIEDDGPDFIDLTKEDWDFSMTPLHYSLLYGHVDMCRLLLQAGANPRRKLRTGATGYRGQSPFTMTTLRLAALCVDEAKIEALVELLFAYKASLLQINGQVGTYNEATTLHSAIRDHGVVPGRATLLLEIYSKHAPPNDWKAAVNYIDQNFQSPLALACHSGYASAVKVLVEKQAEVSYSIQECEKALTRMRKGNLQYQVSKYQTSHAMQIDIAHPAELALKAGNHECISHLIKSGADVNSPKSLLDIPFYIRPMDNHFGQAILQPFGQTISSFQPFTAPSGEPITGLSFEPITQKTWASFVTSRFGQNSAVQNEWQGATQSPGQLSPEALKKLEEDELELLKNDSDEAPDIPDPAHGTSNAVSEAFEKRKQRRLLLVRSQLLELEKSYTAPRTLPTFQQLAQFQNSNMISLRDSFFESINREHREPTPVQMFGVPKIPAGKAPAGRAPAGSIPSLFGQPNLFSFGGMNTFGNVGNQFGSNQFGQPAQASAYKAFPLTVPKYAAGYHSSSYPPVTDIFKVKKYDELFEAVWAGDNSKIVELTRSGPKEDRLHVTCTGKGLTPLMLAFLRGHLETALLIAEVALEQRKTPVVKISKLGANAKINNIKIITSRGYDGFGEEEDDDEDADEEFSADGEGTASDDEDEVQNPDELNKHKSEYNLLKWLLTSPEAIPLYEFQETFGIPTASFDRIKNIGHSDPLTNYATTLVFAVAKRGIEGLKCYLEIAKKLCIVEKSFVLDAHFAGEKISDAEVERLQNLIAAPTPDRVMHEVVEYQKTSDVYNHGLSTFNKFMSIIALDNLEAFEYFMRETLGAIELSVYISSFPMEEVEISDDTVKVQKKKYAKGLSPPSMQKKPIQREHNQYQSKKIEILLNWALGTTTILSRLCDVEFLLSILKYYRESQPEGSPRADRLREPDVSLEGVAKNLLGFSVVEAKQGFSNVPLPQFQAISLADDTSLKLLNKFASETVKEFWFANESSGNLHYTTNSWVGNSLHKAATSDLSLPCFQALVAGIPKVEFILSTDSVKHWNVLHFAAQNGSEKILSFVLETYPEDVGSQLLMEKSSVHQMTPLMVAAHFSKTAALELLHTELTKRGISRDQDVWGRNTLTIAAAKMDLDMGGLGLQYHSDALDKEDYSGMTPEEIIVHQMRMKLRTLELPLGTKPANMGSGRGRRAARTKRANSLQPLVSGSGEYLQLREAMKSASQKKKRRVFPISAAYAAASAAVALAKSERDFF
ncbi:hypothetical protein HDU97_001775 [Phlyctochytrium planicorne]|nr:hypothetical protein HDU97_001775 [Phlyctochytrium planicorne]